MKRAKGASAILFTTILLGGADVAEAWTGKADLISPATCKSSNGRLIECKIPTVTLSGTVAETAVPMRTAVRVVKKGDCTTQYPLEVSLAVTGETAVRLLYLKDASVTLRRSEGQSIPKVKVTDSSTWTKNLNVPSTCRLSLSVTANEVDVSSKKEAQALIADIEAELAAKRTEAEWYGHLIQYHRAFLFLESVAENFHGELTNDVIQELRSGAESALSSLSMLSSECDDKMDDTDRQNIMLLLMSLPQLGSAEDWKNPDGSTKSLADLMGPEAQDIYLTVDKLARENDSATGSNYDAGYKTASEQAAALEYKLALAKTQLAAWL